MYKYCLGVKEISKNWQIVNKSAKIGNKGLKGVDILRIESLNINYWLGVKELSKTDMENHKSAKIGNIL